MMNFAVPILGICAHPISRLGNLGSVCMAIVNYVNAFQLSRPFRDLPVWQSAEGAFLVLFVLCVVAIELCSRRFYISQFSYVIPVMAYTICAMHGFFSAVVWASQGVLLGENSNDNDRGSKSGFFLAVYMFGSV